MFIFSFVMENGLFLITYNSTFQSTFFFPSGGFHAQWVDIHPIKLSGFTLKFWINVWWCYHRVGFECKKQKHFVKKPRSLDFGQIWVNVRIGEHIGISLLTETNVKPKGSAASEHFLLCNHSPFLENFSLLTKENKSERKSPNYERLTFFKRNLRFAPLYLFDKVGITV